MGVMKRSGEWFVMTVVNIVDVLDATESYT